MAEMKKTTSAALPEESVAELKQMLEQAKAELAALTAKAKEEVKSSAVPAARETAPAETIQTVMARAPLVSIRLMKDAGEYKNDLRVCVNGVEYFIPRGRQVQVPEWVYLQVVQSEGDRMSCAEYVQGLERDFRAGPAAD